MIRILISKTLIILSDFFKVHPIQGSRVTQGRGLLNEVCDMNVRGLVGNEDHDNKIDNGWSLKWLRL